MYNAFITFVSPDDPITGAAFYPTGAPVDGLYPGQTCTTCDNPVTWAGSPDPLTGGVIRQDPSTGDHDGLVATPASGGGLTDLTHLRCLLDAGAVLTVGGPPAGEETFSEKLRVGDTFSFTPGGYFFAVTARDGDCTIWGKGAPGVTAAITIPRGTPVYRGDPLAQAEKAARRALAEAEAQAATAYAAVEAARRALAEAERA